MSSSNTITASVSDVKDKGELLKSLRNIRIGEYKLWFNVARFVLEDGEIYNHKEERPINDISRNKGKAQEKVYMESKIGTSEVGERSFKDMLVGKSITIDSNVNVFQSLHGKAVVARMADFSTLKSVKIILKDLIPFEGKIQYMGGLDVLFTFKGSEVAVLFKDAASSLSDKFLSVAIWEGQVLGYERLAWLKVQGVPLHLLSNSVIDLIGGIFGKIVQKANQLEDDQDLSFDYVGVLVGDGKRISKEIVINWKERKFRVWVTEEHGEWVPDFLEPNV